MTFVRHNWHVFWAGWHRGRVMTHLERARRHTFRAGRLV